MKVFRSIVIWAGIMPFTFFGAYFCINFFINEPMTSMVVTAIFYIIFILSFNEEVKKQTGINLF